MEDKKLRIAIIFGGVSHQELITRQIELSLDEFAEKQKLKTKPNYS